MLDILLVDDEADIRLPLGEALRELGHRVALAADGDEAMQCLDRQIFNLVLSDIRLPKVDGLPFCAACATSSLIPTWC